jgi:hypothetical protein
MFGREKCIERLRMVLAGGYDSPDRSKTHTRVTNRPPLTFTRERRRPYAGGAMERGCVAHRRASAATRTPPISCSRRRWGGGDVQRLVVRSTWPDRLNLARGSLIGRPDHGVMSSGLDRRRRSRSIAGPLPSRVVGHCRWARSR